MWGLGSFLFSFTAGYLIGSSMMDGPNLVLITVGLILLLISIGFTKPRFKQRIK